jgi:hypothetical protein
MTRLTSSIYHRANADPPQGEEARRRNREAYAKAWHQRGLVVIDPADVLDDWTRQAIENEANRQYGQRKGQ